MTTINELAAKAKTASVTMATLATETKNRCLLAMAEALDDNRRAIIEANARDFEAAQAANLASPLLKRLKVDDAKIDGMCQGLKSLIELPDPVGQSLATTELDAGLKLYKVTCPIGVIGVIFESRPDALVQISSLCLKSGNAVLLKGGSEAARTNRILADTITAATAKLPSGWLGLLETRADVAGMLDLAESIDLIIPRGSNEFVRHIMDNTAIPVLGHADGICHVYIDESASVEMAVRVAVDSKTQYVAVCNAAETLLVHRAIAPQLLGELGPALRAQKVEIRGCPQTRQLIECQAAAEQDWQTEYLDYIVSVRVVDSLDAAIDHINTYGSGHTDAIVTSDRNAANRFMDRVDAADVMWNCSTRFADGFRYGLGAEVGISTNKIHARGPVGLDGLVIYKYRLLGQGQCVADYDGSGLKSFTHRKLDEPWRP